jgi:CheY-like chemotaxis protein
MHHHVHAITHDRNLFLAAARLPLYALRVLVVDDEPAARDVLRAVLKSEGAEVETAESAASALGLLERWQPDVMLADISMPVMDGFTLVEQLRQRPADRGGQVPVAALTGYVSAEDREHAKRSGFQAYLLKPVDPLELIHTVKNLSNARTCIPASGASEVFHA